MSLALALCGPAYGYLYDPSDFATTVVDYTAGTGLPTDWISGDPFNDPSAALGRPTVDTTGDGWVLPITAPAPVLPVSAAFRAFELVTVGEGGQLTVTFDHPVRNDPLNPYGIDLIIFGNTFQTTGYDPNTGWPAFWDYTDPNGWVMEVADTNPEPATVEVSQDGLEWLTFPTPFADDWAPTLGRVYDEDNPDASVGDWNLWWGAATDPTLPLDPSVTASSVVGMTVAEFLQAYGDSAGGTGFDLGDLGLDWIQYVRVTNPVGSGVSPEIDAFADAAQGYIPEPATCTLLAMGLLGAVASRRRRRR